MFFHHAFHVDRYVDDRQKSFLDEAERDRLFVAPTSRRPARIGVRIATSLQQTLQALALAERIFGVVWARRPRVARRQWPAGR